VEAIVAVGSGKGGVGKTTIAVNLALALAQMGKRIGLLDGDVYGPNVPLMLNARETPKVTGPENRIIPLEIHGVKMISVGLINPGDKPLVWRGPMLHSVVRQFLQQVDWGQLDVLIVDLPPGTGDVALSLIQTVPLTGAIVVSTPSDVSLQDARKAIEMFRQVKVEILGLVENMSYFVCPHCHNEIDVFSKGGAERTAKQFELPFLGSIELDPDVRRGGDTGRPVVLEGEDSPHAKSLYAFARHVIARLDEVKSAPPETVLRIQ
jgi:ATP-binding protein involved in chromosome partitioning